jgi:hypothetical protein
LALDAGARRCLKCLVGDFVENIVVGLVEFGGKVSAVVHGSTSSSCDQRPGDVLTGRGDATTASTVQMFEIPARTSANAEMRAFAVEQTRLGSAESELPDGSYRCIVTGSIVTGAMGRSPLR